MNEVNTLRKSMRTGRHGAKIKERTTTMMETEIICRVGTGLAEVIGKLLESDSMILIIQKGFGGQLLL